MMLPWPLHSVQSMSACQELKALIMLYAFRICQMVRLFGFAAMYEHQEYKTTEAQSSLPLRNASAQARLGVMIVGSSSRLRGIS